jgi:uncharacterized membrane protein
MNRPCKPVLGGTQTPELANELATNNDSGPFTTFDTPGVGGPAPISINPAGAITGYYNDANFVAHGFLRTRDGTITTFDAPGDVNGTFPTSINPGGNIAGAYCDVITCHGFLRTRDGTITTFDPPGSTYTFYGEAINPAGTITGGYADASNANHGFVRDRDGTITTLDVPGANTSRFQSASAINPEGAIAGIYFLPIVGNPFGGNYRGFLRNPDGTFATFDAATYPPCCIWTFATGINPKGAITGYDNDGHNLNHGFLRDPDGTITTFDAPGAGTGNYQGTFASGINPAGAITGHYTDSSGVTHGFLRTPDGTFTTLDPPGSTNTAAYAINPAGVITGNFSDASGVGHGFVYRP